MTELQTELIKIAFDKGLIGVLILLFGFVLNRAIEQYKARNIYYQKLSEAKISAYQKVAKALSVELLFLHQLHRNAFKNLKSKPNPDVKEVVQKANEEYSNSFMERASELSEYSIFFSREIGKAINAHWDNLHRFMDELPKETEVNRILNRFDYVVKELSSSLTLIIGMLQDEVKVVPSDKKSSKSTRKKLPAKPA